MPFKYAILILTGRYQKISLVERSKNFIMNKSIEELYKVFKDRCNLIKLIYKDKELQNDMSIYSMFNMYSNFEDVLSAEEFKRAKNFDTTRYQKRKRCSNNFDLIIAVAKLTKAKMVFGTITVNDNFLQLDYENQKKKIQRYLKKSFFYVIKNADYGKKNDRLHYHFIGLTFEDLIDTERKSHKGRPLYNIKNDKWKDGFLPCYEIIPYDTLDKKKISNYLVKLNNHSNKISVKRTKLSILKNFDYLSKYNTNLNELVKVFC